MMKQCILLFCLLMLGGCHSAKNTPDSQVQAVHPGSRPLYDLYEQFLLFRQDPHFLRHGFTANSPHAGWLEQVLVLQAHPVLGQGAGVLANLASSIRINGQNSRVTKDFEQQFQAIVHGGPVRNQAEAAGRHSAPPAPVLPAAPVSPDPGREIVLVYTGDSQGVTREQVGPAGPAGGLARRAVALERLRAADPDALVVDAGDLFSPTGRHNMELLQGMNSMNYAAAGLGPHDLKLGTAVLREMAKAAVFPLISANIALTGQDSSWLRPYVVLQRGGRRIALTSIIPDSAEPPPAGMVIRPWSEVLARLVPELRAQADCVVLLYQGSAEDIASLLGVPNGIDLVLGDYRQPETLRYQPAFALGRSLGVVRLGSSDRGPCEPGPRSVVRLDAALNLFMTPAR